MSSERPSEESLVESARQFESADERSAFLKEACGSDLQLRQRVESLLANLAAESGQGRPPTELGATILTRVEGADRAASLQAGLAAVFPVEAESIDGVDGDLSVLRALGQTMCVVLREGPDDGRDPIVRPMSSQMPDRSSDGRYRLDGEIARGGMGAILKGRDVDLGRDLAIKVLLDAHKDKPDVVQRFIEEAQIGGQLQHPGIAPIYELGQFADKRPFFAMKLVKGETLAKLLADRTDRAADRGRFIGIFEQVCQTMAYAHSRGVIHRDLKPANIMVGAFGEVQVMDWGLAKVLPAGGVADEKKSHRKQQETSVVRTVRSVGGDGPGRFGSVGSQTIMGSVMGTPAYMPPEQALGEVDSLDERSDVFGLGAILCEILTGDPPYVGDDGAQIFRLASRGKLEYCFARLDASGADSELIALAKHCLKLEPKDRPADAGVLAEQVAAYLESVETRLRDTELERAAQAARADAQAAQAAAERKRAEAESQRAEAERRRAESETQRVEQQQRSAGKLRKLVAGLAAVATVAGLACVLALFANSRANALAKLARANEAAAKTSAADADRERKVAVQAQKETADAMTEVKAQKDRADREAESTQQNLYDAQMHLAQKAWREHRGLSRMNALLANWVPGEAALDRRGWEWFYLNSLPYRNARVLNGPGPPDGSSVVAWHIASDRLAEGMNDGSIRIWDADRVRPGLVLRGLPSVQRNYGSGWIAWSPDGGMLAGGGDDGTVRLWETVDGRELRVLDGLKNGVRSVAFNSEGNRVAAWAADGRIKIWDVDTGQESAEIVHPAGVNRGAWSPDDKLLASAHENGDVTVSGTQSDDAHLTLRHPAGLGDLAWSPDSAQLATVGRGDFSARVWDLASGEVVLDELSHSHIVLSVAWEPLGKRLATGSADQTIKIWNAATGQELSVLRGHSDAVASLAWGPDARLAVTCTDGSARIWNDIGDQEATTVSGHDSRATSVSWSPNGARLATGSDDGKVRVWDAVAMKAVQTIDPQGGPIRALAWSPDSQRLASAGWNEPFELKVWEADSGHEVVALDAEVGMIHCLAWNSKGRLAVGSEDGTIRLIDQFRKEPTIVAFEAHDGPVRTLAWSPQGDRLASGGGAEDWSGDNLVKVWNPISGGETFRFEGHAGPVVKVAWSPDGERVASASRDGAAIEWDASTGQRLVTLNGHNDWVTGVAWSPDSVRLATSGLDDSIRIWDSQRGVETLVLQGDSTMFRDVAWHPDGTRLAAAGEDGRIWIWDATRGFERDTTSRALTYIDRDVASGAVNVEDERPYAESYLRAGRAAEAVAVFHDDFEGLLELAGRIDQQGNSSLADEARATARTLLERRLKAEPDDATLASELADLLLSSGDGKWIRLEPTDLESKGGATLALQGDGSVLASGTNAPGDVYTLRSVLPIDRVGAIRLEALPHPSLPGGGPGRHPSGNFQLSAFRVYRSADAGQTDSTSIPLASAEASFDYQAPDAGIVGLADESLNKVWHVWGRFGEAHQAVLFPQEPIAGSAIVIELHHKDVEEGINLGRFRLSVCEDAAVERERLAALKLTDPWSKLAAAYRLHGDQAALRELLLHHPAPFSVDDASPTDATDE